MSVWFLNIETRARAVYERHGSWWQPNRFTWVYVPMHQAFWQHVLDIHARDDDEVVWTIMAGLPEMVAARTARTRAEAEAAVWRLLTEWAQEPEAPVPTDEDEFVVWDDSDRPARERTVVPEDFAARLAADEAMRAERFARQWEGS